MASADVELTDEQVDKQNALKQAAVELFEDGKLEEALGKFSEAIAIGCASALLYCRRAQVNMQLGKLSGVVDDCTSALAVNPDSGKAYKLRARAKVKLELWEEAHADFQTGLKIDYDEDTEEASKVAEEKALAIRNKAVKERVDKEKDEYEKKLLADKAAYAAAMKAREEMWTDAKEAKYQETCRKAEQEKARKEWKQKCEEDAKKEKAAEESAAKEKEASGATSDATATPSTNEAAAESGGYTAADMPPAASGEAGTGNAAEADNRVAEDVD